MQPKVVVMRGTSGSGKTYIAERVLERARAIAERVMPGEKDHPETLLLGPKSKIGGYRWTAPPLSVVGRYETACGGCDSMSWKGAADDIEGLINLELGCGNNVFLEGLMVATWGADRLLRLRTAATGGLHVIHLTTPLEVCLDSVRARRAERAQAKGQEAGELNPKNTTVKHAGLIVHTRNQRLKGVPVEDHDRDSARLRVLELLGLND